MKKYACRKEHLEVRGKDIYCKGCETLFEAEPKDEKGQKNININK